MLRCHDPTLDRIDRRGVRHTEDALRIHPHWRAAMIQADASAASSVPARANGELRRVLGLAWAEPQTFGAEQMRVRSLPSNVG
jgi:hypothetical protein